MDNATTNQLSNIVEQQQQQHAQNQPQDNGGSPFERSITSKLSDWTSVFDPSVEVEPYKFCWSPSELSPGSKSPSVQMNVSLDESVILEKVTKAREQLRAIFDESCNSLSQEIQRAYEQWEFAQEVYINDLLEREALIRAYADQLIELSSPEMAEFIGQKLAALSASLEQLRLKHESSDPKIGHPERSAAVHLRKWLQNVEQKLDRVKHEIISHAGNLSELQRLQTSLQAAQLEIETDGRQLIHAAKRYFARKALEWTTDTRKIDRLRRNLEVLETRWYNVYLAGVESLEQTNNFIERLAASGEESAGSDIESSCSSEPLRKRRRRSFDRSTCSDLLAHFNGGDLRAESEEEEDEDTIPFRSSEYVSIRMPADNQSHPSDAEHDEGSGQRRSPVAAMETLLDKASPSGLENRTSSTEDGWSSSKTNDVGYSSGENSVHEALNTVGSESPVSPASEEATVGESAEAPAQAPAAMRTKQISPMTSYYRTVPLDDFGTTDTETPRFVPTLNLELAADDSDNNSQQKALSESLVVHANSSDNDVPSDPNSDALERDYKEVMKMMDEQQQHLISNALRLGTSWKELKSSGLNARRLSATPSKWSSTSKMQNNRRSLPVAEGKMSCDASSEDSDYATTANGNSKFPTQLSISFNGRTSSNLLALPVPNSHSQPQIQRKRRLQRPNSNSTPKSMTASLNSSILKNLAMEQSVYVGEEEMMSQSLNLPNSCGKAGRRRLLRRRMRRTASDNTDLGGGFCLSNLTAQVGPANSRARLTVERRNSMESNSSSSTFHESGDAHFEWDEYRDDTLVEDVLMVPTTDSMNCTLNSTHPATPILTPPDVDDNFEMELPLIDAMGSPESGISIGDFLSQSRNSLDESYRLLQSRDDEDSKLNTKNVSRLASENLRQIRAIMNSTSLDLEAHEEVERLHTQWLNLIKAFEIPRDDTLNDTQTNDIMSLFQELLARYVAFGNTCKPADNAFVSSASLRQIKQRLDERKATFQRLQALYAKLEGAVSRFEEQLKPDLDRVNANMSVMNRYVDNLEHFYEVRELYHTLASLHQRLCDLRAEVDRLQSGGAECSSDHIANIQNQIRLLSSELENCQFRMSSLETFCNQINEQLKNTDPNKTNNDPDEYDFMSKFVEQYNKNGDLLSANTKNLTSLEKACSEESLSRPNSQLHDDSYSDCSVASTSEKKIRHRKRTASQSSVRRSDAATLTTPTANGVASTSLMGRPETGVRSRISAYARQNPTVKTLLSCIILIGMGMFLLYMTADDEIFSRSGHWRFKFGPQLRYVNGPPPV